MAKRMVEELIDDLDGSSADGTLSFSYDGASYEMELNSKNRAAFDTLIAPYIAAARSVRGSGGSSTGGQGGRAQSKRRVDLAEIRAWATANGHAVSDRGRVAADIVQAYDARIDS